MLHDPRTFGAQADAHHDDGPAIQAAIAAAAGGGRVVLTAGRWRAHPLRLAPGVELHLAQGAVLFPADGPGAWPVARERWEGAARETAASFISADHADGCAITGPGTIDGRGAAWWALARSKLLALPRPRLIHLATCRDARIEDVTLVDSPSWTIHPYACTGLRIARVRIRNPPDAPNTDGIDPESCRDVRIEDCDIDVGDDGIVLKSGACEDGRCDDPPCEDIDISGCRIANGHGGVVIGSEMSGGVRRVRVRGCRFDGTERGIRIKTRRGRGGCVEDLNIEDIHMTGVAAPVVAHAWYRYTVLPGTDPGRLRLAADPQPQPVDGGTPTVRGLVLRGIRAVDCDGPVLIYLHGLPERPFADITIADADLRQSAVAGGEGRNEPAMEFDRAAPLAGGIFARHVSGLRLTDVRLGLRNGPVWTAGRPAGTIGDCAF
jgi:polygalacturonase